MGNTESGPATNDRPIPLALEGASLLERGFYEAAVGKFKRSYELYKESGAHSSAGRSLRLAAEAGLQMAAPDYELAATAFEEVATLYLTNEITAFAAAGVAFSNALLCLLAAGRIATAKGKLVEFSGKLSTLGAPWTVWLRLRFWRRIRTVIGASVWTAFRHSRMFLCCPLGA